MISGKRRKGTEIRIKTHGGLRSFLSKTLRPLGMRQQGQGINRDGGRLISIEEGFTDDNENVLMAKIFIACPGKVTGF